MALSRLRLLARVLILAVLVLPLLTQHAPTVASAAGAPPLTDARYFVGANVPWFNVSVTVTDTSGEALVNYTTIHVTNPPTASQFSSFASYAAGLLISVVEGILEVAVVILPIALVVGVVILPFRNRMRSTKKEVKS